MRKLFLLMLGIVVALSCTEKKASSTSATDSKAGTTDKHYRISMAQSGTESVGTLHIEATDGFHLNADYPAKFEPVADSEVQFEKKSLKEGTEKTPCPDHVEFACAMEAKISGQGTGKAKGVAHFSVCSADKCLIEKVPLETTFKTN
jgi:hypothetical protein